MRLARCTLCAAPLARRDDELCGNCDAERSARWVLFVLALVFALAIALISHAQEPPPATLSARDRADVQRCLVAEARPGDDYPAILTVLSRRSRDLGWAARHYCALWVARTPSRRQTEIRALPAGPGARRYARHWHAATAAVDAWLSGARPACEATHFGDHRADARRARRAGLVVVNCGHTANVFFREPRR